MMKELVTKKIRKEMKNKKKRQNFWQYSSVFIFIQSNDQNFIGRIVSRAIIYTICEIFFCHPNRFLLAVLLTENFVGKTILGELRGLGLSEPLPVTGRKLNFREGFSGTEEREGLKL